MPNLDVLNRQAQEYNAGLEDYQQGAQAYKGQVDQYNKAVAEFNKGPMLDYQNKVKQYNKYVAILESNRQAVLNAANGPGTAAAKQAQQQYMANQYMNVTVPKYKALMDALNVGTAPELGMAKPEFTAEKPKDPGFTKQQMDALAGKQAPVAQVAADPSEQQGLIARMQGRARPDSMIGGILQSARYST